MDGYWIVRTYEAGNVGEKTKFFVPGARPTRSQRRLRDAARMVSSRSSSVSMGRPCRRAQASSRASPSSE